MNHVEDLLPPEELMFIGSGDFQAIGDEFLGHFQRLGGLRPEHRVLDVGCGVGRMALPLTRYLDGRGGYEGFDIVRPGVEWCRRQVTPRFPNFRFQMADVYNKSYHPAGRYPAAAYRFPYPDAAFDFTFLTSVFTHMLPGDLENYLYEVARVLKPGGRCLATFFLLNRESEDLLRAGRAILHFPHGRGPCAVANRRSPEDAVAHREEFVLGLYAKYGLEVQRPLAYGSWCARPKWTSLQDIVVATRAGPSAPKPQLPLARRLLWAVRRSARSLTRSALGAADAPDGGEPVRRHSRLRRTTVWRWYDRS